MIALAREVSVRGFERRLPIDIMETSATIRRSADHQARAKRSDAQTCSRGDRAESLPERQARARGSRADDGDRLMSTGPTEYPAELIRAPRRLGGGHYIQRCSNRWG
jgi:hypothetical protein